MTALHICNAMWQLYNAFTHKTQKQYIYETLMAKNFHEKSLKIAGRMSREDQLVNGASILLTR